MRPIIEGLSQLKLHLPNTQIVILTRPNEVQWYIALSVVARLVAYVSILGLLVIVISLLLKFFEDCEGRSNVDEVTETETNRLLPAKSIPFTYGTCEEDLESGKCGSSSSEDLYDGKICVICYDDQRNCFFVPCGHCATCHACAQRIFDGESKACPICRRFIHKVRKLFTLQN